MKVRFTVSLDPKYSHAPEETISRILGPYPIEWTWEVGHIFFVKMTVETANLIKKEVPGVIVEIVEDSFQIT